MPVSHVRLGTSIVAPEGTLVRLRGRAGPQHAGASGSWHLASGVRSVVSQLAELRVLRHVSGWVGRFCHGAAACRGHVAPGAVGAVPLERMFVTVRVTMLTWPVSRLAAWVATSLVSGRSLVSCRQ